MIRVELVTRHFTFHAYGTDKADAIKSLRHGWNNEHLMNYPEAMDFDTYVDQEGDDFQFSEVKIGVAYRDNEEMRRRKP